MEKDRNSMIDFLFIVWSMDRSKSINAKAIMMIESEAVLPAASLFCCPGSAPN